jgi:hypothetical protein
MSVTSPASGALAAGLANVTFAGRYGYVEVYNSGTTSANVWYVTTDGSTPALGNGYLVGPGQRAIVPNKAPLWYQGFNSPNGANPQTNPGTVVKIVSFSTSDTAEYEVTGV